MENLWQAWNQKPSGGWAESDTQKTRRSNSYKDDGVGTSGEWASERPHARNRDSTFEARVTELREQDK